MPERKGTAKIVVTFEVDYDPACLKLDRGLTADGQENLSDVECWMERVCGRRHRLDDGWRVAQPAVFLEEEYNKALFFKGMLGRLPMAEAHTELMSDAERRDLEGAGTKVIREARTLLILGRDPKNLKVPGNSAISAFYSQLAMRLDLRPDWKVQTMATDGRVILFNPRFTLAQRPEERVAVVCHEVRHCALKHPARREGRDEMAWNISCDLSINNSLRDEGFLLPKGALFAGEGKFNHLAPHKTAEWYYPHVRDMLAKQGGEGAGKNGPPAPGQGRQPGRPQASPGDDEADGEAPGQGDEPSDDPGGCGAVRDTGDGSQADKSETAAEWEVAVKRAVHSARSKGRLPASIDRLEEEALTPKVDWQNPLREFVNQHARNDYRLFPPNRRFIGQGIYLPGMRSEELGSLLAFIDTSGSISREMLRTFSGELTAIAELFGCKITIVYCDARVQHVQVYDPKDGPLVLEAKGGGGTSHVPAFEWLEKNPGDWPCVVALTDLYTDFPEQPPAIPVLWCVYDNPRPVAPFGQVIKVE